MAYGGKIGIDATSKTSEEKSGRLNSAGKTSSEINQEQIKKELPEITGINSSLLSKGISMILISVNKNRKNHIKHLSENLFNREEFSTVKLILFLEGSVDVSDVADSVWRFTNNLDPKRDHFIYSDKNNRSHIAFDGTRKTKEFDDFQRDWPNVLVSDDETIAKVDEIWDKLGLGKFIESPSKKYRKQVYGTGAIAINQ
jgi:4-hydroxy-3-polyprenylbenzoate decarboxylase